MRSTTRIIDASAVGIRRGSPMDERKNVDDRKRMMQMLLPAAAAAGVVVLVGVLIATSEWNTEPSGKTKGKAGAMDDSGMSSAAPALDDPAWQPQANGMRIWDVQEGEGPPCPRGAQVIIHYTGWLTNGTKFDSSRDRGQPTPFALGDLIKGWQEGIPGMKPGGIRRLLVPSDLGYGLEGRPPKIPGGATLIFEVKLLSFQ
jgi:FKBP-type peptidyl-prolyl cis-trans isomerase